MEAARRLKRDVEADYNSKGQVNWRRGAREDFDFEAGEQLNEEDEAILQDAKRPIAIFNPVGTTVDSVAGQEVGNRQEVQFLPRRLGVAKKNELLTSRETRKGIRTTCGFLAFTLEDDAWSSLMGMMYVADFNVGDGWTSAEYTVDQEEMLVYNRTNDRWPIRVDQAAIKSRFWWIERHWCTGRPMK
jgi:hypothetical protein